MLNILCLIAFISEAKATLPDRIIDVEEENMEAVIARPDDL